MVMAAILDILVKMIFQQQTDVRIGILVVDIVENMYFNFILAALVRKSIFKNGIGGHFGFGPLAKKRLHISEGPGFSILYKVSKEVKSIVKPC